MNSYSHPNSVSMEKFFVLFLAPLAALDEWSKTDPVLRKSAEVKMEEEWRMWMQQNASSVGETAGAGKTKRITSEGITDVRNEVMLFSQVQARSHEEAAALFTNHPHLQIPGSSIEVMVVSPMAVK